MYKQILIKATSARISSRYTYEHNTLKPSLYPALWEQTDDTLHISTSISGLTVGHEYKEVEKRTAILNVIEESVPLYSWTHTYTDKSDKNAVMNKGPGAVGWGLEYVYDIL